MRETGVVRRLPGNTPEDTAAAQPYIAVARTQLGITKNLMQIGGLASWQRTVRLSDGTVIVCRSVMGQDAVAIMVPQRVLAAASTVPSFDEPVVLVEKPKKQRPVYEWKWFALSDGPPKYGHEAWWDADNNRMLVYGGFDNELPEIAYIAPDPGVDHMYRWTSSTTTDLSTSGAINALSYTDFNSGHPASHSSSTEFPSDGAGWSWTGVTLFGWDRYKRLDSGVTSYMYDQHIGVVGADPGAPGGTAHWARGDNSWYDYTGSVLTYLGLGDSGQMARLYASDNWADHADGFHGGYGVGAISYPTAYDLMRSNQLWEYTEADGWTQLADISRNAWLAMVTSPAVSEEFVYPIADYPPGTDATGYQTTVYDPGPGGDFHDYKQYVFGGTIDGTRENASAKLWVSRRVLVRFEDDPDA